MDKDIWKQSCQLSSAKKLDVTAEKSYVIEEFMSIADVMNALVPTIRKRKETLETMYLHTSLTCDDSLTEFFIAILCLKNVQYLIISIYECGNLFDSLLEAAAHVCPRNAKPTGIRRLALSLQPCTLQMHSPHSFTPLLEYYSECHAVNNIHFDLPKICWENRDSFLAWRKIVLNMPKILDFTCDFDLYEDCDDKVTKVLEEIISGHQNRKEIRYVSIRNLYNADRKCFDKMVQLLAVAGAILHYDGIFFNDCTKSFREGKRKS